jgi:hypothetical protein
MGASLSIHNDTADTVFVKTGDDEAAINIGNIVSGCIAAVALGVATAGVGTAATAGTLVTITATAANVAGKASTLAQAGSTVIRGITAELNGNGYTTLRPGQTYYGPKQTLSLWQQCHVIRVRTSGNKQITEGTYMRPIFTGATDNSCNRHDVAYWVRRYPYEHMTTIICQAPAQSAPSHGASSGRPGRSVFSRGRNEHTLYAGERLDHDQYIVAEHYKLIQQSGELFELLLAPCII